MPTSYKLIQSEVKLELEKMCILARLISIEASFQTLHSPHFYKLAHDLKNLFLECT